MSPELKSPPQPSTLEDFKECAPPEPLSAFLTETMCRVDLGTPTLEDLYFKISGFPEMLQTDNLPMLSKASCLAQIASARALERIAGAMEIFCKGLAENERTALEQVTSHLDNSKCCEYPTPCGCFVAGQGQ